MPYDDDLCYHACLELLKMVKAQLSVKKNKTVSTISSQITQFKFCEIESPRSNSVDSSRLKSAFLTQTRCDTSLEKYGLSFNQAALLHLLPSTSASEKLKNLARSFGMLFEVF